MWRFTSSFTSSGSWARTPPPSVTTAFGLERKMHMDDVPVHVEVIVASATLQSLLVAEEEMMASKRKKSGHAPVDASSIRKLELDPWLSSSSSTRLAADEKGDDGGGDAEAEPVDNAVHSETGAASSGIVRRDKVSLEELRKARVETGTVSGSRTGSVTRVPRSRRCRATTPK